jgi:DNA-binding beta-propeller fold protein YncE
VSEVDPDTLAFSDVVHFIQPYSSQSLAADASNLYVIAMNATNSIVNKLDFATWSTGTSLTIGIPTGHAMRYDGTNLYATLGITNATVAKIAPGPLTLTATNAFAVTDQRPTDDLTFTATDVWVGLEDTHDVCLKIAKSDLSITRVPINQPDGSYGMWFDGALVWDLIKTSPGRLLAIDPATLAFQTYTLTEDIPNEIQGGGVNLYVTYWQSPAKIQRLSR